MRDRKSMSASSVVLRSVLRWEPYDIAAPARTGDPTVSTHRVTYSDRLKVFLGRGEALDSFLRPLRRLDGFHRYSVNMTRLAEPMRPADIDPAISSAPGREYLQCTGSADALTVEMRTAVNGTPHRFTVGLPGDRIGTPAVEVPVPVGLPTPRVYPDEVFTAEQAAEIFTAYFETDAVPPHLQLRETDA
ncbi:hypothetical protein [Nocardia abscessus]|uniref:hypothetical protein n=1 Tax=Nocardia abscessus TaxID=120957 RepID=UPI0024589C6B|nr:hypothetical protein [Nocardia abscessus]